MKNLTENQNLETQIFELEFAYLIQLNKKNFEAAFNILDKINFISNSTNTEYFGMQIDGTYNF